MAFLCQQKQVVSTETSCQCKRRSLSQADRQAGETLERFFRVLDPWQTLSRSRRRHFKFLSHLFPAQLVNRAPAGQLTVAR